MTIARATTDKPRNRSLSISAGAGVKYSACNSMYSKTASPSHTRDAPKNIQQSTPTFSWRAVSFLYQTNVEITTANTAISKVKKLPPYRMAGSDCKVFFSIELVTSTIPPQTVVTAQVENFMVNHSANQSSQLLLSVLFQSFHNFLQIGNNRQMLWTRALTLSALDALAGWRSAGTPGIFRPRLLQMPVHFIDVHY